ncbi:hypothetical protein CNMCM5793_004948 [Aspergillus hiratsukae]|uniref:Mitochondrial division protein 1 n=1 Tax=Aspergillus hiratsukae TaxID=1194566 RepID=A0A8H6UI07_9EURO|nr:hypothetical protein CNMCM5793_004948 [Aspergillus hiratsukae]
MSMLGIVSEVLGGISTLQLVVQDYKDNLGISEFLHDAQRFILRNSQIADIAPLQIYSSGLIFAPKVEESWSPDLQTLEGHSGWVQSVAFSADGRLLASGSNDETIKLWDPSTGDPSTGALKHTLEGHSDWVQSVAFLADGRLLASGSGDKTIKLWDPSTGALKHTLEGHSGWVQSVAFSADGRLLASGSSDKTIKLWDPSTGDPSTGALKHTMSTDGYVNDIEFSFPYLVTNRGSFNIQA